jgi:hypothetical protein
LRASRRAENSNQATHQATRSGARDVANIKDFQMKRRVSLLMVISVTGVVFAAPAFAKPCDEVKAEIAAKLDAKGVVGYTIEAIPVDQPDERKQVGTCDAGAKKIVYSRGS